jgi:dephospho-CoA kinase
MATPFARPWIGLTGGIGCGKSTVADGFAALGAGIVDTDAIAHALTAAGGAAMPALIATFGPGCASADGAMDRARMRARVFGDPDDKARLEAILHPMIQAETLAQAQASTAPYVLIVVPLLVESGHWKQRVARVLVVDCEESTQVARVMARNNMPEKQVKAIMATQATRAERLAAADDVIQNDGDLETLTPQIARLHDLYSAFSQRMATNPLERL